MSLPTIKKTWLRFLLPEDLESMNAVDRYRWRLGLSLMAVMVFGPLAAAMFILFGEGFAPPINGWIRIVYAMGLVCAYLVAVKQQSLRALGWLVIIPPMILAYSLSQTVFGIYALGIWSLIFVPAVSLFISGPRIGLGAWILCETLVFILFKVNGKHVPGTPPLIAYLGMHIGLSFVGFLLMKNLLGALETLQRERDGESLRAARAEQLAGLGILSAGVAHEINNPLTVIAGASERLLMFAEMGKLDSGDLEKQLRRINHHAFRISKIIRTLMRLSKPQEQGSARVHVEKVLEYVVSLQGQLLEKSGIALRLEPVDPGIYVMAGETDLTQILVNLVTNSYDAIRKLEERWVRITVALHKDKVVIEVTDSGYTRDMDARKVFAPFYTTKPAGSGTGLGLSLSRSIAEARGGSLDVVDESEHTCFRLVLPGGREAVAPKDVTAK